MDVYSNFFTNSELIVVEKLFPKNLSLYKSNHNFWSEPLYQGFSGQVFVVNSNSLVKNLVRVALKRIKFSLVSDNIVVQYCIWEKGSGINAHIDTRYVWAATVYLNKCWSNEFGGILSWKTVDGQVISHIPCYNSLVINSSYESHWVSRVVESSRLTLQVWCKF